MGKSAPFCLSYSHYNFNITSWKKRRWCAWDSNPELLDGRHRQNHGRPILKYFANNRTIFTACPPIIQCDQIRRNITALAIFINLWPLCESLFSVWQFFKLTLHLQFKLGTFYTIGKFSFLQMAKSWNNNLATWSHC